MNVVPRSLIGRTALSLGLLMAAAMLLCLVCTACFIIWPIKTTGVTQISDTVVMVQRFLTLAAESAPLLHEKNANALLVGLPNLISDQAPRPLLEESNDPFVQELSVALEKRIGSPVIIQQQRDAGFLWVRFPVGEAYFWLRILAKPPLGISWLVAAIVIVLALSIGGSYLIIFSVTRQLRQVTKAVRLLGEGKPPRFIPEEGALETRDLARGFNQMTEALEKVERERRLMLAGISHDLRTPLTRLRIAIKLAGAHADPAIAAGMDGDIEDLDAIVTQFLDYARDGSDEEWENADLDLLVKDIFQRFRSGAEAMELKLGNVPLFPFKKLALRRAITNLVDNALKYGRTGIIVETWCTSLMAAVRVTDNGPGIQKGRPEDFIKPFVREDVSRSTTGTGLGLAIVERVVREHGGSLQLENRPHGGFSAVIEIPLRRAAGANVAGPERAGSLLER
jgi:two-component system osmolarity sensor histidine kinase EnvZ